MGTGKVALQLFLSTPTPRHVYGVELAPSRWRLARQALQQLHRAQPERFGYEDDRWGGVWPVKMWGKPWENHGKAGENDENHGKNDGKHGDVWRCAVLFLVGNHVETGKMMKNCCIRSVLGWCVKSMSPRGCDWNPQ